MFQSGKDTRQCAFSADESGGNLPPEFAPWREPSELAVLRARRLIVLNVRAVETLQRQGYYLFRVA
jgi:hypothetical protein